MWGEEWGGGLQRRSPWRRVTQEAKDRLPHEHSQQGGQEEEDVQHVLQEVLFPTGLDAAHEVTHRREAVQVPDLKVDLFLEAQPGAPPGVHQKARHTEHHNKDSEREAKGDGKNEFTHSGITHMSESKVDLGLLASNHMAVTQSQESMATMRRGQWVGPPSLARTRLAGVITGPPL